MEDMEDKEIHLRDYLRIVAKRRYTVFTFFTVVFVIVLIATFSATPIYMAATKVLIKKSEQGNLANMNFYYVPYDPDFYETQYQLIKSVSVAEKVVKILSLDKTYETYFEDDEQGINIVSGTIRWFKEFFSMILKVAGITKTQPDNDDKKDTETDDIALRSNRLAKMISGSITVNPVKNSKIVNISYMSTNPEIAALIVNSITKAYMEDILEMKMSSSRYAIGWLTKKADEERAKLDKSEKALQKYMRAKDIVTLENRLAMVPEKLSEVATKLARAETKRKELESLYNMVRGISQDIEKAETIPAVASDPTIQSLREQILKAEQNIMDMSKRFGKKHPAMIAAIGDLKGLKDKKTQEIRRVIKTIKNEYEIAKANEKSFRKLAAQTKADTLNLSEKFIQYRVLKREVETNKQMFDAIIKRIKERGITQDVQTVDVWVVEKAEIPEYPVKPRKFLNILLGLIVGIFGGIGMAFFIEYLDNTIKLPEDAETRLGVPVLGLVTLLKSKEKKIEDIVLKEPRSDLAESYKIIRTAILLSGAGSPPRNILVTSISPGEGKTVTSVNLAITIAQAEHSVLLLDSDLRRPRIHRIFEIDNSKGLSTYLAGATDINIVPLDAVSNLSVMPSGPIPPNPSELLGSGKMHEMIKVINERFDIIIWDSAPLMSVTDTLILSKVLDGTIIVVKAGKTTYDSVNRGLKSLDDIKSRFLGIVINALDEKKSDFYQYKYYDYQYPPPSAEKQG